MFIIRYVLLCCIMTLAADENDAYIRMECIDDQLVVAIQTRAHWKKLDQLRCNGANVCKAGLLPLAIQSGDPIKTIEWLLSWSNPSQEDKNIALCFAVAGPKENVELLLKCGAECNRLIEYEDATWCALEAAVFWLRVDNVRILLEHIQQSRGTPFSVGFIDDLINFESDSQRQQLFDDILDKMPTLRASKKYCFPCYAGTRARASEQIKKLLTHHKNYILEL